MPDQAKKADLVEVDLDTLKLPMPCFYLSATTKEWKQGTIVHIANGGHGMQAIVKPADSDKFVVVVLEHDVRHGYNKPDYVPK